MLGAAAFLKSVDCTDAAKMPPEAWYEMHVKPWHPELAMVGMCVLSQFISVSLCKQNWSLGSQTHSDEDLQQAKLSPETTEKLVYVYLNSKMATNVSDANEQV